MKVRANSFPVAKPYRIWLYDYDEKDKSYLLKFIIFFACLFQSVNSRLHQKCCCVLMYVQLIQKRSAADPFHFCTEQIWILGYVSCKTNFYHFFLLIAKKMIYYYNYIYDFFYVFTVRK